ncbi:MAG: Rpn family recombination-promoting nuclease/putative transposase [Deltaproteobacteria bacterium]|nr:Rpn family recombination-promoting nuclease/putative transposase [Deltaproteobacteria bacterium]
MNLLHRFTSDTLFKALFSMYPDLLKRVISLLLDIPLEAITEFTLKNQEMPALTADGKSSRLDVRMMVNGKMVTLEVQVAKEPFFVARSLFYWSRQFSGVLKVGQPYSSLPPVIIISLLDFVLFDYCDDWFSCFWLLEVKRHTRLSDLLELRYYELPKLPKKADVRDEKQMVLALFKAKTKEQLKEFEKNGGPLVKQLIEAYHHVVVSEQFQELELQREMALHDEATAMESVERKNDEKWQRILAAERESWQRELAAERESLQREMALHDKATAMESVERKNDEKWQRILAAERESWQRELAAERESWQRKFESALRQNDEKWQRKATKKKKEKEKPL